MKQLLSVLLACALLCGAALAETASPESYGITLVENATTGYLWSYAVSDETVLSVIDGEQAAGDESLAGAPGTHSFSVVGVAAGEASVTFTYSQPWDGGETGESFIFTFAVDEALQITILDTQSNPGESDPDLIILTQYEDPATGLVWDYELSDDSVLQLAWDDYNAAENADGTQSATGMHHWAFQAVGEGNVHVNLICLDANDEEQAVVTYEFAVQGPFLSDALQTVTVVDDGPFLDEDEFFILSEDEVPFLEDDERILLSEDGVVVLVGDEIIRLSEDDLPLMSQDDIVQIPMLIDTLQSAAWFGDEWVPGDDDIFLLSQADFPWMEEDERILLSEDGIVVLDGDETVTLIKDEWPLLSEDDIVQFPMIGDALQGFGTVTDGWVPDEDEFFLLSRDEVPFLEEDEYLALSEDGIVCIGGDETVVFAKDEWPLLSEDDIVQFPMIGDALQGFGTVTDGWVPDEDEFILLSRDEVPFLEEDERILLSEDGIVVLDGDETVTLIKDEWPLLSEDDIVQLPLLGDALQSVTWQDDGRIMGDEEILLLSEDEVPFLEEDERILLSEDGVVVLVGDEIIRLSEDDLPILSEDDIVQKPFLNDALQTAAWHDDGKIMSDQEILLLSQDDLPFLEEDERILLSEDGIVVLDGDQTNSVSKDKIPILSEDDIVQFPVLNDVLQTVTVVDDGPVLSLQESAGEVAVGDREVAVQNDDLLIVPLSVEGNMNFVPEILQ